MRVALIKNGVVQNVIIADLVTYVPDPGFTAIDAGIASQGWSWDGTTFTPPVIVPTVPSQITDRQFLQTLVNGGTITQNEALAMLTAGTFPAAITTAINSLPVPQQTDVKMKMADTFVFQRNDSLTVLICTALGKTSAGIDALFTLASTL